MIFNFFWILFAHYLGDFQLQGETIGKFKRLTWYGMLTHCMIWAGVICIALQFLGLMAPWKAIFLVAGHWFCDGIDPVLQPRIPKGWRWFWIDQIFHLGQLVVVFAL